jgi:hypothetical protein
MAHGAFGPQDGLGAMQACDIENSRHGSLLPIKMADLPANEPGCVIADHASIASSRIMRPSRSKK